MNYMKRIFLFALMTLYTSVALAAPVTVVPGSAAGYVYSPAAATSSGSGKSLHYQEFTASGTFTPSAALIASGGVVEVFAVGGGGGGGSQLGVYGGGGGGGGVVTKTVKVLAPVAVTIGAGGVGGWYSPCSAPTMGGNTLFGALITAYGGGIGGGCAGAGGNGASGGGATSGGAVGGATGGGGAGGDAEDTPYPPGSYNYGGVGYQGGRGGTIHYGTGWFFGHGGRGVNGYGGGGNGGAASGSVGIDGGGASATSGDVNRGGGGGGGVGTGGGNGGSGYLKVTWWE